MVIPRCLVHNGAKAMSKGPQRNSWAPWRYLRVKEEADFLQSPWLDIFLNSHHLFIQLKFFLYSIYPSIILIFNTIAVFIGPSPRSVIPPIGRGLKMSAYCGPPTPSLFRKKSKTDRFSLIQRMFSTHFGIIASRNGQFNMTSPLIYHHMLNQYIWKSPE